MKLIAGLGNPGKNYERTRHNLGFRAVGFFLSAEAQNFTFLHLNKRFNALVSEGSFENEKIILACPQTFMNSSGTAIKTLSSYYKINPQDIWIIHDDLDLVLGKLRISQRRSSGGHKGVQSIIDQLGTNDFLRFRIGIRPINIETKRIDIEKFVLQKFTTEEEKIIQETVKKVTLALKVALEKGIGKAMCEFN